MTCVLSKTERRSIGRCSGFFCLLLVRHYTSYGAMTERGLMPPSFGANRSLFFSNKRGTSFSNKRGTLFSNKRGTTYCFAGVLSNLLHNQCILHGSIYRLPYTEQALHGNSSYPIGGVPTWFGGWIIDSGYQMTVLPYILYLNTTAQIWSQFPGDTTGYAACQ